MSEGFLAFLLTEPSARRIFGRRELKIVEKQLRGVRLTQSEKNRLSRDVRKKLEFVKRAARFESEFELKKGAELQRKVGKALDAIRNDESFPRVRRIWLFGSAAANERTLRSDIDVAVELDARDAKDAAKFRSRVSGSVPDDIDIQVLNLLPRAVRKEAVEKGRILYERANER